MITKTRSYDAEYIMADEENNCLLMDVKDDAIKILYTDLNEKLIRAAEDEGGMLGKKSVYCDFSSTDDNLYELLEKCGYELTASDKKIISVRTDELFASRGVQKSLGISFSEVEWIPFGDLQLYQVEDLLDLLEREKIPLKRREFVRFDEELSGIVYDSSNRIRSFIFVSSEGSELIIECLYGTSKDNAKYILTALQGFGSTIRDLKLYELYDRISMLEFNKTVMSLLQRLIDSKYSITQVGCVIHAGKLIKMRSDREMHRDTHAGKLEVAIMQGTMTEKILHRHYQGNINWKTEWSL